MIRSIFGSSNPKNHQILLDVIFNKRDFNNGYCLKICTILPFNLKNTRQNKNPKLHKYLISIRGPDEFDS